jgi:hypothetical protein
MSDNYSIKTSDPLLRTHMPKFSGLNKGVAIVGIIMFISGIFIPSVRLSSSGATIPIFAANPPFASVYIMLAVAALVLIMSDFQIVPALIGTTLGLYLVIIGIPAVFQGLLGPGFTVVALGDILLIAGCLYPQRIKYQDHFSTGI